VIHLTPEQHVFVTERHVATLTTLRPDGTPHVVPVAFTWDAATGVAWMTSEDGSAKVRNVEAAQGKGPVGAAPAGTAPAGTAPVGAAPVGAAPAGTAPAGARAAGDGAVAVGAVVIDTGARGVLCQVSGGRWLTLEGELTVSRDPAVIADAERRYAVRYGPLDPDPRRVVLNLAVDRVLGSEYMTR